MNKNVKWIGKKVTWEHEKLANSPQDCQNYVHNHILIHLCNMRNVVSLIGIIIAEIAIFLVISSVQLVPMMAVTSLVHYGLVKY